jgi:hypothetical protein
MPHRARDTNQHQERHACQKFQMSHLTSDVCRCWDASQRWRGPPRPWQTDHRFPMAAAVRWQNSMQLSDSTMRPANCFASRVIASRPAPCFWQSETFASIRMPTCCFMPHFRPTSGIMRHIRKGTLIWRAITTRGFARLSSRIIIWIRLPSIRYPAAALWLILKLRRPGERRDDEIYIIVVSLCGVPGHRVRSGA